MKTLKSVFAIASIGMAVLFSGCQKKVDLVSFSVSPSSVTLTEAGQIADVTVTPLPSDATVDFSWSSDKTDIAKVEKTGDLTAKITAVANGTAVITVVSGAKIKTVSVTVNIGGDPEPPDPTDGDGTQTNPYTVAQVIAKFAAGASQENDAWVNGYIVGGVATTLASGNAITVASDVVFGATGVRPAAVVIADSPNEKDWQKVVVVKLTPESGGTALAGFQDAINLNNRPCNIGKTLKVKGNLWRYFAQPAVREVSAFESNSEPCPAAAGLLSETLLTQASFDKFTAVSTSGAQVWTFSSSYGAVMSGYADNTSYANEDWFISPVVDLSSVANATLSFEHARGPAGSINVGVSENWYQVFVTGNYTGDVATTTWTELTGITHGTTAWAYVNSGSLTIPAAAKTATTRFAFKYRSADGSSATWEVKNVVLAGE
ncbi:MAG: DUF6359 domain-containing protein [Bacteroidales bacterium]|jgi:hypothetical protein|nr:DUF6359 domain-containing protein [Bacteroidales bacterium]